MSKTPLEEFLDITELKSNPNYVQNLFKTAHSKNITLDDWNTFITQFQNLIARDADTYLGFNHVLSELQSHVNFINLINEDLRRLQTSKLDKVENPENTVLVYATQMNTQHLVRATHTDDYDTLMYRSKSTGQAKITTPTQPLHIANKEYVDNHLPFEKGIGKNSVQTIGNVAGLKGFYWKSIEESGMDAKITLSTKNGDFGEETDFDIRNYWAAGDKITIHSDQHHIDCAMIEYFDGKDVMYVTMLSFTPTNESKHHTDQAVYVLAKPDKGLVDFGQNSVAFGNKNKALGYCNITAGVENEALDQYGAVFGNCNKVGYASGAFGKDNEAKGMAALVAGGYSKANGKLAIALGRRLNVEGTYNFSANNGNKVYGFANTALNGSTSDKDMGDGNEVYGMCNLAIGHNNTATENAKYAFVGGDESSVSNEYTSALGYKCQAQGKASHAGGSNCIAEANGSFAHGEGLVTKERDQAVFGKFNKPTSGALLVVGVGKNADSPANALEVYASGIAAPYAKVDSLRVVNQSIQIGNTTVTEAQLIKLLALVK